MKRVSKSPPLRAAGALASLVLAASHAWADESAARFNIDGFGTFGVIHSDYEKADFVTSGYFHPTGVGYSRSWASDEDSNLGLQVSAKFGDRLTAVVQAVAERRRDNSFRPQLEWANLRYEISPEWHVRIGRIVLPTFLNADTRKVGYVNPWVRRPAEMIAEAPFTNSDGADLSYQFRVGVVSNRLQLVVGQNKAKVLDGYTFENHNIRAVSHTLEYGPLTLHLGYQRMRSSYELDAVENPPRYSITGFSAGFTYEPGAWYVSVEALAATDGYVGNTQAWSAGGGYRFGSVTPYVAFARVRQTSTGSSGLAPLLDQETPAIGIRWDFAKNLDAKLQYERVELGSTFIATSFIRLQPDARLGDRAHVLSATLDFVW